MSTLFENIFNTILTFIEKILDYCGWIFESNRWLGNTTPFMWIMTIGLSVIFGVYVVKIFLP